MNIYRFSNTEQEKGIENYKLFPVTVKIELENLKAAVCCNCISVFLFIKIILILNIFLPIRVNVNCSSIFFTCELFLAKKFQRGN